MHQQDEVLGFAGLRAVDVDPIRSMKFKIADFTRGVSNSRREFTSQLLRGGPVTPAASQRSPRRQAAGRLQRLSTLI